MGGDPKPKLFDWPTIAGLPNPPVLAVAPNPEFGTPKPVLGVLEQKKHYDDWYWHLKLCNCSINYKMYKSEFKF